LVAAWLLSDEFRYLARAGFEEARILLARRPIADMVRDPSTEPATRAKLELVLEARDFARDSLGLEAGETYTTYARVRRDTLLLVVSASRYDRLAPHYWTYPIVGRVPYKGFFDFERATREARRLERAGMDTYVRPAVAFSTLGWFEDPLLSTVVRGDSADLVATVIHEILHNTIFLPGEVAFNESLANFAGHRGAERFFRARGDGRNAARVAARWRDELRLGRFYEDVSRQLEALYAPGIAGPALREERIRVFRLALSQLSGGVGARLETIDGSRLAQRPLNNAVVLAQRLYRTGLERFDRVLERRGGDLRAAIVAVSEAARSGENPWDTVAALELRP
jgi:predicted aminopeptidase